MEGGDLLLWVDDVCKRKGVEELSSSKTLARERVWFLQVERKSTQISGQVGIQQMPNSEFD